MREPSILIEFNGELLPRDQWRRLPDPFYNRVCSMSGAMMGAVGVAAAASVPAILRVYTTPGTATETIPQNSKIVYMEAWGGGAGGGASANSVGAGGGGGGGYSNVAFGNVWTLGGWGKTFTYTIGTGGAAPLAAGINGGDSTIVANTVTNFFTITCLGGTGGQTGGQGGAGGSGGAVTNNNPSPGRYTGNNGANHSGATGGAGGAGINVGFIAGDGAPYGAGGRGADSPTQAGSSGGPGAVVFYYT